MLRGLVDATESWQGNGLRWQTGRGDSHGKHARMTLGRTPLEEFLAGQSRGDYDSNGQFTIDSRQALEMLSQFQLVDYGHWVVKLVQAGVALGVSRIECTLGRSQTEVRFQGGPVVDALELARCVLSGEIPKKGWRQSMVAGLRAFYGQKPLRLSWWDEQGRMATLKSGQLETGRAPSAKGATLTIQGRLHAIPNNWARLNHLLGPTAMEHQALSRRCAMCHVPIVLDGRCVSQGFPEPPCQGRHAIRSFGALAGFGLENKLPFVLRSSVNVETQLSCLPEPQGKLHKVGFVAMLYHPTALTPLSSWSWIKDGVLLDPRPIDFPHAPGTGMRLALCLFLDGSDIEVDLSGFTPRGGSPDLGSLKKLLLKLTSKLDMSYKGPLSGRPLGWSDKDIERENRQSLSAAIKAISF